MNLKTKHPIRLENNLNDIQELWAIQKIESINSDLIRMFFGSKIGAGQYRHVYEFNPNPDKYVIKVESKSTECNANEFLIWDEVSGLINEKSWVKDWFAPVLWMSPDAKILIMERTQPTHKKFANLPTIPSFLSDVKSDNFGWIGDKFVCHDYGFINRFIRYDKKFRNVKW